LEDIPHVKLGKDEDLMSQADELMFRTNDWMIPYTNLTVNESRTMLDRKLLDLYSALDNDGDILGEIVRCRNCLLILAKNTGALTLENLISSERLWQQRIPEGKRLSPPRDR
jgi:hypothetical protein